MSSTLQGRTALVSGGARGLGAGMAQALAAAGAAVMIGDILEDRGRETARSLVASGGRAAFVHLDVTDEASWLAAICAAHTTFGGFDILINNAGVEETALVSEIDADAHQRPVRAEQPVPTSYSAASLAGLGLRCWTLGRTSLARSSSECRHADGFSA